MICIHSRRDFRPNNVNGCWNGANEVKYAAINAGPRFYNALTCTRHAARTKGLVVVADSDVRNGQNIIRGQVGYLPNNTAVETLDLDRGATIETRRAWRSPRLPLGVDTLVDPPIHKIAPPNSLSWDPVVTPQIQCPTPLALNIHHSTSFFPLAWRQGRTKCASASQRIPYLAPPSHLTP